MLYVIQNTLLVCLIGSESHTEEVDLLVMIKVLVAALVKIFGHSLGDF